MSSSNRTDNLNLSQFSSNDKPGWLSDYNADMKHIDDHVGAAAAGLAAHIADEGNPHGVTAGQVGAASSEELNAISNGLVSHKANMENPHGVTATQVGVYTKAEIDAQTLSKNAYDELGVVLEAGGIADYVTRAVERTFPQVEQMVLQRMYPVGAIYASFVNNEPSAALGFGTWSPCFVGRSPIGVDENDANYNLSEKRGGEKTVVLTGRAMPTHTHDIPKLTGNTSNSGAHTHNVNGTAVDAGAHTHITSGRADSAGSHSHTFWYPASYLQGWEPGNSRTSANPETNYLTYNTNTAGAHQHTTQGTAASAGLHAHSIAGTAESTGSHLHTVETVASISLSTGNGEAHNNMHPYETAYFWKRTA